MVGMQKREVQLIQQLHAHKHEDVLCAAAAATYTAAVLVDCVPAVVVLQSNPPVAFSSTEYECKSERFS